MILRLPNVSALLESRYPKGEELLSPFPPRPSLFSRSPFLTPNNLVLSSLLHFQGVGERKMRERGRGGERLGWFESGGGMERGEERSRRETARQRESWFGRFVLGFGVQVFFRTYTPALFLRISSAKEPWKKRERARKGDETSR